MNKRGHISQPDQMLAALRVRPGVVVEIDAMAEVMWPLGIKRPQQWRDALASVASNCRKRGHHVELVSGLGYRLIEGDKR